MGKSIGNIASDIGAVDKRYWRIARATDVDLTLVELPALGATLNG